MRQRKLLRLVAALLAVLVPGLICAASPPDDITAEVTPAVIPMGTFYSGSSVHIEGRVPANTDVIVAVRGPEATEVFNQVGRAGPIWVNKGKVSVSGIPSLLLVFSTKPIHHCLCRGELDRCQLDAAAIRSQIKVKPPTRDREVIAGEFLKLKYRQKSYQLENAGIRLGDPEEVNRRFALDFHWPRNAASGTYLVSVCACKGGDITESVEIPLKVVEVGFPATIAYLARERPATYGIISVVVAVLAGFGIDFLTTRIFKKKVSSAH
jgi:hypothetical protein